MLRFSLHWAAATIASTLVSRSYYIGSSVHSFSIVFKTTSATRLLWNRQCHLHSLSLQFAMSSNLHASAASPSSAPLSSQELRTKRLMALGILQAQPISIDDVNKALHGAVVPHGSTKKNDAAGKMDGSTKGTKQEVIELLNDSDDDIEEALVRSKDGARGTAGTGTTSRRTNVKNHYELSDDDDDEENILEAAKRIQKRKYDKDNDDDDDLVEIQRGIDRRRKEAAKKRDASVAAIISQEQAGLGRTDSTSRTLADGKPPKKVKVPETTSSKSTVAIGRSTSSGKVAASGQTTTASLPNTKVVNNTTAAQTTFQVATWNVWFGPEGTGFPHGTVRMRTICRLLQELHSAQNPMWCIGFQEVVTETEPILRACLEAAGYQFYAQRGAAYYCALAVHSSVRVLEQSWRPYSPSSTCMARGFLYARIQVPFSSQQILCTTTHLESFNGPSYTGAKQRPLQLGEMQNFCREQFQQHANLKTAVLTGDMNWDDLRPTRVSGTDPDMMTILSDGWKDSWLETKPSPSAMCFTYDAKVNPMLGGHLRRRFDRIVVNRKDGGAQAVSTQLLGTQAIPDLEWPKFDRYKQTSKPMPTAPSDHFGFAATFQIN